MRVSFCVCSPVWLPPGEVVCGCLAFLDGAASVKVSLATGLPLDVVNHGRFFSPRNKKEMGPCIFSLCHPLCLSVYLSWGKTPQLHLVSVGAIDLVPSIPLF